MIDPPELLAERACALAGLSDFGPEGWRDGLERLVDAVRTDIGADRETVDRIEALIIGRLKKRLRVEGWYSAHGAEAARPVRGPLIIVGLPRTGTTALHHLLALDPQFRYLRKWEVDDPVPPPGLASEEDDPRLPRSAGQPDEQHIRRLDGPVEDGALYEMSFHHSEAVLPVPSYTRAWRTADHAAGFEYHERVLRLLHSHRPPDFWLLKFPNYLFQLQEIAAQYPDAKFVMTHRDPVAVVPSTCSVIVSSRTRRLPAWSTDREALGPEVLEHLTAGVRRGRAGRSALGDDRFLDVGQPELETDPVAIAQRVYEFAGLELSDEVRTVMKGWAGENQRGSSGRHDYTAEEFGLSSERIADAFAGYLEEFGTYCRRAA